jgi:hypothetical protein
MLNRSMDSSLGGLDNFRHDHFFFLGAGDLDYGTAIRALATLARELLGGLHRPLARCARELDGHDNLSWLEG